MRVDKILQPTAYGAVILGLILLSLAFVVMMAPISQAQSGPVVINEIRIDQTGADNDEYFELTGPAGYSLDNLTYLVIGDDGGVVSGTIECVVPLAGYTIPADGYFVVAEDTFTLGGADVLLAPNALNFENSDNVTHLLVYGFTGALGDDLDVNDDCSQDIFPWSMEYDRIALVEEDNPPSGTVCHYGPPQIGPDGSFVPGHVYRCAPDTGAPYGWVIGQFDPAAGDDTPGAANYNCDSTAVNLASVGASSGGVSAVLLGLGLAAMLTGGSYLALRRRRK